ncbi:hypothetical protein [Flavobacterium soli]|uniref:hypothetical protein n=1 Tax=Flavobacterium soli TaxID=344881 RepID=UPI0003FA7913|nr:hypothetical protein [Flavobacterium soli]
MKKLFIFTSCCFIAILFTTSCTSESIEDDKTIIQNNNTPQVPTPPPPIEHGDDDKDKDKDRD